MPFSLAPKMCVPLFGGSRPSAPPRLLLQQQSPARQHTWPALMLRFVALLLVWQLHCCCSCLFSVVSPSSLPSPIVAVGIILVVVVVIVVIHDHHLHHRHCQGQCGQPVRVGDGVCDDNNNNCNCDWDQGDCCGKSGEAGQFSQCLDCHCLDPAACSGQCGAKTYIGDGFCDDNNNNCGCDWDQGDCCGKSGKSKQFSYCTACDCLNPAE